MISGSGVKIRRMYLPKIRRMQASVPMIPALRNTVTRAPLFTRSRFRAPMFWPMKVVAAMAKLLTGRTAKPSSLL